MNRAVKLLLVEDEPLILMDLEFAVEDLELGYFSARSIERALMLIERHRPIIGAAVLDATLDNDQPCLPVAARLGECGIPYILHTGDLNRYNENINCLAAPIIAKPAPASRVIELALEHARGTGFVAKAASA